MRKIKFAVCLKKIITATTTNKRTNEKILETLKS